MLSGEKLKQINQVSAVWCLLSNDNQKNVSINHVPRKFHLSIKTVTHAD